MCNSWVIPSSKFCRITESIHKVLRLAVREPLSTLLSPLGLKGPHLKFVVYGHTEIRLKCLAKEHCADVCCSFSLSVWI